MGKNRNFVSAIGFAVSWLGKGFAGDVKRGLQRPTNVKMIHEQIRSEVFKSYKEVKLAVETGASPTAEQMREYYSSLVNIMEQLQELKAETEHYSVGKEPKSTANKGNFAVDSVDKGDIVFI